MNKMSSVCECPICMDDIFMEKNCVTTECGHCFHASCLMTNVARNGFGCPYCRTAMAEVVDDDDEDEETILDDDASNERDEELYDDYTLRGLRFFNNLLNGEEHDHQDVLEEDEDLEEVEEEPENAVSVPSHTFITQKLVERGVTMEDLVKALLSHHEEYEENEDVDRVESEIWGKFRIIISNYTPEQAQVQAPVVAPIVATPTASNLAINVETVVRTQINNLVSVVANKIVQNMTMIASSKNVDRMEAEAM